MDDEVDEDRLRLSGRRGVRLAPAAVEVAGGGEANVDEEAVESVRGLNARLVVLGGEAVVGFSDAGGEVGEDKGPTAEVELGKVDGKGSNVDEDGALGVRSSSSSSSSLGSGRV